MAQGINRATLPDEFYDKTSTRLLIQPEPQYMHGRMLLSAVSMGFERANMDMSLPLPGRDLSDGSGAGDYIGLDQLKFELDDPLAEEAIMVMTDFAPGSETPGHVIRFNRPKFADTTYSLASRRVAVGSTISVVPVNVQSEQVPLIVDRYAGPYDSANSRVAPLSISRFDAERMIHPAAKIAELHFTRDFHKFVDKVAVGLFDAVSSSNIVRPANMTADNDATQVGDFPMDYATLLDAEKVLDDLNIPRFSNGRRICVLTTLQTKQLVRDPEYQRLAQYHTDYNPLFKGTYVGTVGNIDIHKSTTLTQTANSSSIPIQYGQMFGPGMVGVGPAGSPRVVPNVQDNYGEDPIAIWIWYCAFGVLNETFGVSIRTS